jgi:hypothetical protein
LYGLVRSGQPEKAVQFLRETRHVSRSDALKEVHKIAANFGLT